MMTLEYRHRDIFLYLWAQIMTPFISLKAAKFVQPLQLPQFWPALFLI